MTEETQDTQPSLSGDRPHSPQQSDHQDAPQDERKRPGKKPLIILAIVVLVLVVIAIIYWLMNRGIESTDDAFTDGNAVVVSPRVSGYITELRVKDNQKVNKGDLLAIIDPRDAIAQRDQANAQLALARAQYGQAEAQLALAKVQYPAQEQQARANLARAKAELSNATAAYHRQHGVDPKATSQTNIDAATAQWRSAQAEYQNAEAQVAVASQVELQLQQQQAVVEARHQQITQAQARLEAAELNLSYTHITAPYTGYVTRRNVERGSLVQAGNSMFSLVSPDIWITANFKESQLQYMQPGDKVSIRVDAFPDLRLQGHVDSIQMGSGSHFSAFPAENATGNFVKIVQRVPVKIVIDSGLNPNQPLPLGLSVEPEVTVR